MGHAPNTAICSQGVRINFYEKLMQDLSDEVVRQVKSSDGLLPDNLAKNE
jgi:hypothetical protein